MIITAAGWYRRNHLWKYLGKFVDFCNKPFIFVMCNMIDDELGFYSGIFPLNDTILMCILPFKFSIYKNKRNVLAVNNCRQNAILYALLKDDRSIGNILKYCSFNTGYKKFIIQKYFSYKLYLHQCTETSRYKRQWQSQLYNLW